MGNLLKLTTGNYCNYQSKRTGSSFHREITGLRQRRRQFYSPLRTHMMSDHHEHTEKSIPLRCQFLLNPETSGNSSQTLDRVFHRTEHLTWTPYTDGHSQGSSEEKGMYTMWVEACRNRSATHKTWHKSLPSSARLPLGTHRPVVWGRPVHWGVLGSSPGLCPLQDARSLPLPQSQQVKLPLDIARCPLWDKTIPSWELLLN